MLVSEKIKLLGYEVPSIDFNSKYNTTRYSPSDLREIIENTIKEWNFVFAFRIEECECGYCPSVRILMAFKDKTILKLSGYTMRDDSGVPNTLGVIISDILKQMLYNIYI